MNLKETIRKNPKFIVVIVIIVVFIMLAFSLVKAAFSSDSTSTSGGRKNYSKVYAIPGVTFEVSQDLSNYATAVTEISKDVDFIKNASYSYKNGTDTYMLFNMAQYVIVAKKGTTFDLHNTNISDSLKNNSLGGIWFTDGKMVSNSDEKKVCDVSAQVVITNTIYNDFYGKLATVTYNEEEWTLFVGCINPEDSSMASMISYTVDTFIADASNAGEDVPIYEVEVSEQPILKAVEEIKEEHVEDKMPEETSAKEEILPEEPEVSVEEPAVEEEKPTEEIIESSASEPSEETDIKEGTEETPVEEPEPSEEIAESEPDVKTETVVPEEKSVTTSPDKTLTATNNQKATVYSDDKAYTSTIYSMLNVGKIGYMTATNQNTGSYDEIFIRIASVNDEDTTNALIKKYIDSGDAYYDSIEAPAGTHWESVTYNVKHESEKNYYINIQFVGMDGENLKHRGIGYSMRTYDIINNTTAGENGWINGYVAFYAVPNGCTEYSIACGDSVEGHGYKAYYKVNNK